MFNTYLSTLFAQDGKCDRIVRSGNRHQIRKWTLYLCGTSKFINCQHSTLLSAVGTVEWKFVCISSAHGRMYMLDKNVCGVLYLSSRHRSNWFEICLPVFPGWPRVPVLHWTGCFSCLNPEHMLPNTPSLLPSHCGPKRQGEFCRDHACLIGSSVSIEHV